MKTYKSLKEIELDVKRKDLEKQIALEKLKLSYKNAKHKLASIYATRAAFSIGKKLVSYLRD